ncbi:hypothetical protein [Dysgonomonas sp. BGC7]|uniref:hypothetical protein n=1 Tax=Dysgonomonas sp. BGC7 TaxID=1658008 RepID=UPI0006818542|nr:hypothetical protein [Dysgonomonas sp. BGC7]MBD8388708.1 hypothetical protein [Dysgonomonas sp. BGC7]
MERTLLYLFTTIISINCGGKSKINKLIFDDHQKDTVVMILYVYPRSDISKGYKFSLHSNKIFEVEKGTTSLENVKLFSKILKKDSLLVNKKEFNELFFLKEKIINNSPYLLNRGIRGGTEIYLKMDSLDIKFYYESERDNDLGSLYRKLKVLSPIKIE